MGCFCQGKVCPGEEKYLYRKRSIFIGFDGMDRRDRENLGGLEME